MLLLEIAVVALLIVVNGLLALSELAIVSSRPARLNVLIERNVKGARRALALASDPGRFLSTVQIGITLVGILSGAFSGTTLGARLAGWLEGLGMSNGWANALGFGAMVVIITYASLIVGELVPKQIALRAPESVAVRIAPAMTLLATAASPLVWLLDASGRTALHLLGQRGESKARVTEEEIKTLIAEAETAGVLEPGERQMIAAVLRLGDRPARAVMTPRGDVDMVDLADDPATIRQTIIKSVHSRLPVCDGSADHVIGIVQAKDMLDASMRGEDLSPRRFIRPAPIIPETADILDVLKTLKNSPVHIGLVHDEYGLFEGVVTTADILESIVGTFRTEEGHPEPALIQLEDGSYLVAGSMPADEFADAMRIRLPEERSYHTVAGFVLDKFGHVPGTGAAFTAQGWRFEVVDLDGRRIDKIRARRLTPARRASTG
ncbi:MAG: hemolysin family protein [Alphaproteobacteria bacterium]|nr:hemolysin family protein [Alphaproteobacteria bacterium]